MARWGRERGTAKPRDIKSAQRIFRLRPPPKAPEFSAPDEIYRSDFGGCRECSVGSNTDPIPSSAKRQAEFVFRIGKHNEIALCRGCALQWADDFASQIETLAK